MLKQGSAYFFQCLRNMRQDCILCHQYSQQLICATCTSDLPLFDYPKGTDNLLLQPNIKKALITCNFPELKVLAAYTWPLNQLLLQLKFNRALRNAPAIAQLFCRQVLPEIEVLPQVLFPVPLHHQRYLQRHYNQALLLAEHIGRIKKIAVDSSYCQRIKATAAQTSMSAAKRHKNLHNAFAVTDTPGYQHIAIVDDVLTTGATASSLYSSLKRVLPQARIEVWAMCISLPRR